MKVAIKQDHVEEESLDTLLDSIRRLAYPSEKRVDSLSEDIVELNRRVPESEAFPEQTNEHIPLGKGVSEAVEALASFKKIIETSASAQPKPGSDFGTSIGSMTLYDFLKERLDPALKTFLVSQQETIEQHLEELLRQWLREHAAELVAKEVRIYLKALNASYRG